MGGSSYLSIGSPKNLNYLKASLSLLRFRRKGSQPEVANSQSTGHHTYPSYLPSYGFHEKLSCQRPRWLPSDSSSRSKPNLAAMHQLSSKNGLLGGLPWEFSKSPDLIFPARLNNRSANDEALPSTSLLGGEPHSLPLPWLN